jgi:hypothetical protein
MPFNYIQLLVFGGGYGVGGLGALVGGGGLGEVDVWVRVGGVFGHKVFGPGAPFASEEGALSMVKE